MRKFIDDQTSNNMQASASFEDVFNSIDIDGDGEISFSEFISAATCKNILIAEKQLILAFNHLDSSNEGWLDQEKLKVVFKTPGASGIIPNMKTMWAEFIAPYAKQNPDKITFREFKEVMQQIN